MARQERFAAFEPNEIPAIAGSVLLDGATLTTAAGDWGHISRSPPPRAVVRPAAPADVVAVLGFASARNVPIAARGAGHSPFGQAQAPGDIVLDMTSSSRMDLLAGERLVVDAGAQWKEVLTATLPLGLTPPVLTDHLGLTVGGTLAVGGIGGASSQHGAQTDMVVELEVVTGSGELVTCSAGRRRELFDAARAGLGQCGVIARATLQLVPARQRVRRWTLFYDSLDLFLAEQRVAVRVHRFDYVEGQILLEEATGRWLYVLDAAAYYSGSDKPDEAVLFEGFGSDPLAVRIDDTTYFQFLDRMSEGVELRRADGSWFHPHPWLNLFLPDEAVARFVTETIADTGPGDLGAAGLVLLYPLRSDRLRTPMLRRPSSPLVWLLAILRTADPSDSRDVARMIGLNSAIYRRTRDVGGTAYPTNALPMTAQDWREHFGVSWRGLQSMRRRLDPSGVLTPGQGLPAPWDP